MTLGESVARAIVKERAKRLSNDPQMIEDHIEKHWDKYLPEATAAIETFLKQLEELSPFWTKENLLPRNQDT